MTNEPDDEKYSLSHSGDHHLAKVQYDPKTGAVSAGIINNFSNNASGLLQFTDGKAEGQYIHSGDNHNIALDVNSDGTFSGSFEDKNSGVKIEMQGGAARLISGQMPAGGLAIEADHHVINLKMDDHNNLSGSIESKDTQAGNFKISIEEGKISGSYTHSGDDHDTSLEILPDGKWRASLSGGSKESQWTTSVENGNAGIKATAGLGFSF